MLFFIKHTHIGPTYTHRTFRHALIVERWHSSYPVHAGLEPVTLRFPSQVPTADMKSYFEQKPSQIWFRKREPPSREKHNQSYWLYRTLMMCGAALTPSNLSTTSASEIEEKFRFHRCHQVEGGSVAALLKLAEHCSSRFELHFERQAGVWFMA